MGTIMAVCVSPRKGTPKTNIGTARLIAGWGLEHDSYAGSRHRQVSLLSYEKIEAFRARGAEVEFGVFGENLVVRGFDFAALPVGARFACGDVVLEMTRIGRECHSHCAIFEKMGECMMPTQGVFARVLCGGPLSVGDELELLPAGTPLPCRVAVLTASDKGSRGERVDESGALIAQMCEQAGMLVTRTVLLPDERDRLAAAMRELCDGGGCDLLLTTGGTGFAPPGLHPGSDPRYRRADGPRYSRGHGCQQPAVYPSCHADPCGSGHPGQNADRQPARQPQGGTGKPFFPAAGAGARPADAARRRRRVRPPHEVSRSDKNIPSGRFGSRRGLFPFGMIWLGRRPQPPQAVRRSRPGRPSAPRSAPLCWRTAHSSS